MVANGSARSRVYGQAFAFTLDHRDCSQGYGPSARLHGTTSLVMANAVGHGLDQGLSAKPK